MAALDFPTPTANGQVFNADTGVIYTYVGTPPNGYWSGFKPDSGTSAFDTRYLKQNDQGTKQTVAGGGGLDIAGYIDLDGTTGKVTSESTAAGDPAGTLTTKDYVDGQTGLYVAKAGDTMTGSLALNDKIALNATDGGAQFTGNVSIGNATSDFQAPGVYHFKAGGIGIRQDVTSYAFQIYDRSDTNRTVGIMADGTASFAGNVTTPGVVFGTPAGNATSKTLDDYEEGTWTPVITSGGWTVDRVNNSKYTKVGRQVTVECFITGLTGSPNTTTFEISGLPFNAHAQGYSVGVVDFQSAGLVGVYARVAHSNNLIQFFYPSGTLGELRNTVEGNDITNGYIILTVTYTI